MRDIRLEETLKIKVTLLPSLVQLAKICSLNILELRDFLYHELENNIILEKRERILKERFRGRVIERDDFDLKEFFQIFSESDEYERTLYSRGEEEEEDLASLIPARGPSLYERLSYQIEFAFKNEEDKRIANSLIDYINKEGFIEIPPDEISKELNVPVLKIEEIRYKIMHLDPIGVGARNIREALLVQLEVRKLEDTLAYELLLNHFEKLNEPPEELAQKLNRSVEEIKEAFLLIKRLNPKPGLIYAEESPQYVVPEYVIKFRDNELVVEEVRGFMPEIRLNSKYLKMLDDENVPKEVKKFLNDYVRKAKTLFDLLNERRRKLEKIVNFIVDYQREFFMNSEGRLKPISQTDAAKKLNMPVSTLHRLITGKYVSTPRGIFELKFFFPRGLRTRKGKTFDRDVVKSVIKELIDNEDPESPLSDGKIRNILRFEKGIDITRREVCKLRKELGIENYSKRKRKYKS